MPRPFLNPAALTRFKEGKRPYPSGRFHALGQAQDDAVPSSNLPQFYILSGGLVQALASLDRQIQFQLLISAQDGRFDALARLKVL